MTFRYLHIGINFGGYPKVAELEPVIESIARDWVRYTPSNWIIWTDKTLPLCSHALKAALSQLDQFMIFELATGQKDGFHYTFVWNWLNTPRNPFTGFVPGKDGNALAGLGKPPPVAPPGGPPRLPPKR